MTNLERIRDTTETLPLGGAYPVTRHEVKTLSDYVAAHDDANGDVFTLWRGTSGMLYVKADGGSLYKLSDQGQ